MTPDQLTRHLKAYADAVEPFPPDLSAVARRVDRGHRLRTAAVIGVSVAVAAGAVAAVVRVGGGGGTRADRTAGSPTSPVYGFTEDATATLPHAPDQAISFARLVAGRVWVATGSTSTTSRDEEILWAGLPGSQLARVATYDGAQMSVSSTDDEVYVAISSSQDPTVPAVDPILQVWDAATATRTSSIDLGKVDGADGASFPYHGDDGAFLVLTRGTTTSTQQVRVATIRRTGDRAANPLSLTPWRTYAGSELRDLPGMTTVGTSADGDTTTVTGDLATARPYPQNTTVTTDASGSPRYLFAQGMNMRALERLDLTTGQLTPLVVAPDVDPNAGGESAGIDGILDDGQLLVNSDEGLSEVDPATGTTTVRTHGYGNSESLASGCVYYFVGGPTASGSLGSATASLDPTTLQEIGSSIRPVYRGLDVETYAGTLTSSTYANAAGPRTITLYRLARDR